MSMQIQFRRGTATQWIMANPILAQGEIGIELDVYPYKFKMGDGVTHWNALQYYSLGGGSGVLTEPGSPLIYNSTTNTLTIDESLLIVDGANF